MGSSPTFIALKGKKHCSDYTTLVHTSTTTTNSAIIPNSAEDEELEFSLCNVNAATCLMASGTKGGRKKPDFRKYETAKHRLKSFELYFPVSLTVLCPIERQCRPTVHVVLLTLLLFLKIALRGKRFQEIRNSYAPTQVI